MQSKSLVIIAVLFVVGCGRSDQPTIRHTPVATGDSREKAASTDLRLPSRSNDAKQRLAEKVRQALASRDFTVPAESDRATNPHTSDVTPSHDVTASPANDGAEGQVRAGADSVPAKIASASREDDGPASSPEDRDVSSDGTPRDAASASPAAGKTSGTGDAATASADAPAGSPAIVDTQEETGIVDRRVRFGGLLLEAPDSWVRKKPPTSFMLAVFNLPGGKGEESNAQLTITMPINNDPESLNRLREQIQEEEQAEDTTVEHRKIADHEVVLVDSTDEDDDSDDPKPVKQLYRSLNAMVFVKRSVFFVNCSGPEATVTKRVDEFRDFIERMKADN